MTNMGKTVSERTTGMRMVLLGFCAALSVAPSAANGGEYRKGSADYQVAGLPRESNLPVLNLTCESTVERCQPMAPLPRVANDDEPKALECACVDPVRGKVVVIETETASG